MQPSTLVLCPRYLVLGASVPPCLGLDTRGTLGSSVPQTLDSLGASASSAPQEQHTSTLRRHEAFRALCSSTIGATLLQSLGTSVLRYPRCFKSYTPRHFDASKPFEPCVVAPLVSRCSRASVSLVPQVLHT
ncbi:UNVERIFIED_CONTAM: hypothetical protein FKN15_039738 [Acipenser sinensis]